MEEDKRSRYNGHVVNCLRQGIGTYDYPGTKYKYEGEWNGGKKTKNGKFSLPGYFSYEGDFVDGEITGKGKKMWADGRIYEGELVLGEMHGVGTWTSSDGKEIYEGDFVENKRSGKGTLTNRGGIYQGEFLDNTFHGTGNMLREGKYALSCPFDHGIGNGEGYVTWNKLLKYEGPFKNGFPSGKGRYVAADGSFYYEGELDEFGCPSQSAVSMALDADPKQDRKRIQPPLPGQIPGAKKGAAKDEAGVGPLPVVAPGEHVASLLLLTHPRPPEVKPADHPHEHHKHHETAHHKHHDDANAHRPDPFPTPHEISRRLRVTICPVTIPVPDGSPEPKSPIVHVDQPIPLWRKKTTLSEVGTHLSRFPATVTRVVHGRHFLTGEPMLTDLPHQDAEGMSVAEAMHSVKEDDLHTLCIDLSNEQRCIVFHPEKDLPRHSASLELGLCVDFRLDAVALARQLDARSPADTSPLMVTVWSTSFGDETLSLCVSFPSTDPGLLALIKQMKPPEPVLPPEPITTARSLPGSSHSPLRKQSSARGLPTMSPKPSSRGSVSSPRPPPPAEEPPLTVEAVLSSPTWSMRSVRRVIVDEAKTEETNQEVETEAEPQEAQSPVSHVKTTVLSEWEGQGFNPLIWHSCSVTARRSPAADGAVVASYEWVIDGHSKRKLDTETDESQTILRWLDQWADGSAGHDPAAHSHPPLVLVLGDVHATVRYKTIALFNRYDRCLVVSRFLLCVCRFNECSAEEITACYDEHHSKHGWKEYQSLLPKRPGTVPEPVAESPRDPPPAEVVPATAGKGSPSAKGPPPSAAKPAVTATPGKPGAPAVPSEPVHTVSAEECDECTVIEVLLRAGRGEIKDLVIPPSTEVGVYAFVVHDGVDDRLFSHMESAEHPEVCSLPLDKSPSPAALRNGAVKLGRGIPPDKLDNFCQVVHKLSTYIDQKIYITHE